VIGLGVHIVKSKQAFLGQLTSVEGFLVKLRTIHQAS